MNWSMRKVASVLLVVAILSGGMLSGASDAWAQKKKGMLAQQVQGTWTLVSLYVEQDGKKVEPFGSKPRGFMTLTPEGRFSVILLRESQPKFAAYNRMKGTAEENQAVVQGSLARGERVIFYVNEERSVVEGEKGSRVNTRITPPPKEK